jgi:hypothetical protein
LTVCIKNNHTYTRNVLHSIHVAFAPSLSIMAGDTTGNSPSPNIKKTSYSHTRTLATLRYAALDGACMHAVRTLYSILAGPHNLHCYCKQQFQDPENMCSITLAAGLIAHDMPWARWLDPAALLAA